MIWKFGSMPKSRLFKETKIIMLSGPMISTVQLNIKKMKREKFSMTIKSLMYQLKYI